MDRDLVFPFSLVTHLYFKEELRSGIFCLTFTVKAEADFSVEEALNNATEFQSGGAGFTVSQFCPYHHWQTA